MIGKGILRSPNRGVFTLQKVASFFGEASPWALFLASSSSVSTLRKVLLEPPLTTNSSERPRWMGLIRGGMEPQIHLDPEEDTGIVSWGCHTLGQVLGVLFTQTLLWLPLPWSFVSLYTGFQALPLFLSLVRTSMLANGSFCSGWLMATFSWGLIFNCGFSLVVCSVPSNKPLFF